MIQNVSPNLLPVFSILTSQVSLFPTDFGSGFDCFFLANIQDPMDRFRYSLLIDSLIPWGFLVLLIMMILAVDKIKGALKYDTI